MNKITKKDLKSRSLDRIALKEAKEALEAKKLAKKFVRVDAPVGGVMIVPSAMKNKKVYTITGTPKQIASALNHVIGGGVEFADGAVVKMAKK